MKTNLELFNFDFKYFENENSPVTINLPENWSLIQDTLKTNLNRYNISYLYQDYVDKCFLPRMSVFHAYMNCMDNNLLPSECVRKSMNKCH